MDKTNSNDNFFLSIIKGIGIAIIATLIGVLLFAIVVKYAVLKASVVKSVNQFIKVLAVFLGCFFSLKGSFGFLRGLFIGVLSTVIVYLIFSWIGGEIQFGFTFIVDLIFTGVIGIISGIISVNVKK